MANIGAINNARSMYQVGMEQLASVEYARNMHPVGALAVIHSMLVLPESEHIESLDTSFAVLDDRLRQTDALQYEPKPRPFKRMYRDFQGAISDPFVVITNNNQRLWPPALEIIRNPINEAEVLRLSA